MYTAIALSYRLKVPKVEEKVKSVEEKRAVN